MAKKQKTEKVEVPVVETPIVETPKPKMVKETPKKKKDDWIIKDRIYELIGARPLMKAIKAHSIYFFDEEKGHERELKYTSNQRTPFVDEFPEGSRHVLEHVIFRNGILAVPREKTVLQKLMSLYHPHRDKLWYEVDAEAKAEEETHDIDLQLDAMNLAREVEIDAAEAILRSERGSDVAKMSSKELRRDLLLFARKSPRLFLELASDDNVYLRNMGIKAVEANIIKMSPDQRSFKWATNDRKLMNVPYDEHPYSALAAWFKTDEGMEVFNNIEKRLN